MKLRILGVAACVVPLAALGAQSTSPMQKDVPVTYTATMNASSETPPNPGDASGKATLRVGARSLSYEVDVRGLSGPATMAHIHVGKVGAAGPPVFTFPIKTVASGRLAKGVVELTGAVSKGVSGDSLKVLLANGSAYINVHTKAHPGGEIRGQVVKK